MRRFALAILLIAVPAAAQTPDAAKKDLEKLQGEWTLASLEVNAGDVDLAAIADTRLTVKGDSYVVRAKDVALNIQITLDPAKDPNEIDLFFVDGPLKDRTIRGIYKFDGETFKIVRGLAPDLNRPRDFATWPNSGIIMGTWKRKSP